MRYGEIITITDPTGHPVKAQVGEDTPNGPMIHIQDFQIEATVGELEAEGWRIRRMPGTEGTGTHGFAAEAKQIVDALLNDEEHAIATQVASSGPRRLGQYSNAGFPQRAAQPSAGYGRTMNLPRSAQGRENVKAEVHGDVAVFQNEHGHWTARNLRTQNTISLPDKEQAIKAVAY